MMNSLRDFRTWNKWKKKNERNQAKQVKEQQSHYAAEGENFLYLLFPHYFSCTHQRWIWNMHSLLSPNMHRTHVEIEIYSNLLWLVFIIRSLWFMWSNRERELFANMHGVWLWTWNTKLMVLRIDFSQNFLNSV